MANGAAFESILFPVDFSHMSEVTASYVRGLAQLTRAKVTLLHVVPWLSAWYGTAELRPAIAGDLRLHDLERQQKIALEAFQQKHFSGTPCQARVDTGAVAETITDVAKEIGADLIMMPTRGLGRSRRFLIGSTTAKVLHDAPCAVWTSPHFDVLKPFSSFRHLLCTIDPDHVPAGFVDEVTRLATGFGSKLSFVTARSRSAGSLGKGQTISPLPNHSTVFEETGPVGDVVRRVVQAHDVDLVVANRGHIQHPFGKLRTHTFEIVLESPCPVLSLCISTPAETGDKFEGSRSIAYSSSETIRK
jgi:nucleotide-binding universal stress UspA family protein